MQETQILREARLAGGFTFREVGEAARLDPSTLCHYEVGKAHPSEKALRRWRISLSELLTFRARQIEAILERI